MNSKECAQKSNGRMTQCRKVRTKKHTRHSPQNVFGRMYNILSDEIGLSPGTLASFYHHRTNPRKTTMNKIIPWIEREGKRVVSFASSNSSIINNEVSNS
ncbi:hypothetical protein GLOIN_2v906297 [Rhizophagus irregularis DAOM 181602=DAOM 197198]|nr:hypothetical protein GLOIN_2v906297 [Rhizophagus irregularis DAOM 181602=DAOM 197198]